MFRVAMGGGSSPSDVFSFFLFTRVLLRWSLGDFLHRARDCVVFCFVYVCRDCRTSLVFGWRLICLFRFPIYHALIFFFFKVISMEIFIRFAVPNLRRFQFSFFFHSAICFGHVCDCESDIKIGTD